MSTEGDKIQSPEANVIGARQLNNSQSEERTDGAEQRKNKKKKKRPKRQRTRSDSGYTEEELVDIKQTPCKQKCFSEEESEDPKSCKVLGEVLWEGVSENGSKLFCIEKDYKKFLIEESSNKFEERMTNKASIRTKKPSLRTSESDAMFASYEEEESVFIEQEGKENNVIIENPREPLVKDYDENNAEKQQPKNGNQFLSKKIVVAFCFSLFLVVAGVATTLVVLQTSSSNKTLKETSPFMFSRTKQMNQQIPDYKTKSTSKHKEEDNVTTKNMLFLDSTRLLNTSIAKTLVILGGERGKRESIVDTVEVISPSSSTTCKLPSLPRKLKWGNAGFVSNQLMVCGGQTARRNLNRECWTLEAGNRVWENFLNLTRYICFYENK